MFQLAVTLHLSISRIVAVMAIMERERLKIPSFQVARAITNTLIDSEVSHLAAVNRVSHGVAMILGIAAAPL